MIKLEMYETKDRIKHDTKEKAESHCLNKAHLILNEILKNTNCEAPYRISQQIIENFNNHKELKKVVYWLIDINMEE